MDEIYCFECKRLTENKNPTSSQTFDRRAKISACRVI